MAHFRLKKGFITQKHKNKTIIFDGEKSILYTFNHTAGFIFQKIKAGWEKKRILAELTEKYHLEKRKAKNDLDEFIKDLVRKKIIVQI